MKKTVSEVMETGNTIINELRNMTKDFRDLCDRWEQRDKDEYVDQFIQDYQELIYEEYCEVNPEEIHSDFSLEDIDPEYLVDFVQDFMEEQLLAYIDKKKYGIIND